MEATWKHDYEKYAVNTTEIVEKTISDMDYEMLEAAAKLILDAKKAGNRLHISGIGKPAHIAGYIAPLSYSCNNISTGYGSENASYSIAKTSSISDNRKSLIIILFP